VRYLEAYYRSYFIEIRRWAILGEFVFPEPLCNPGGSLKESHMELRASLTYV
jgi:hypothetical protein